ncbi:isochorismatase family protein [Marinomonas pollencensis]|uniref:Nicotinamidase-related amidase n=1 Tax=Marinomonas pollencensis TaxID=491954 RepID=A0A3E0DN77_9GAMM|nr:isochorismatase family protein [Marinomonas pollencensis]REG84304.1 nicotinamidase-related amidase [Marinomonas pollencensis]
MLVKETTGLIVVDIQGKLARQVYDSEFFICHCEKLIKAAQTLALPIIYLEQNPDKLGSTIEEIHSLLAPLAPIEKFTFNACEDAKFVEAVQAESQVTTWLVCGIETHICVYQTAIGLLDRGYGVHLVSDCVASRTQANKQLGITALMNKGAAITGLEMCLYELVKDSRAPEFRSLLGLIR